MKIDHLHFSLLLSFAVLFTACTPSFQVKLAEVQRAKKIAIVGFTLEQEVPNEASLTFGGKNSGFSATRKKVDPMKFDMNESMDQHLRLEPAAHAEKAYQELKLALEKNFKLRVVDANTIRTNPKYWDMVKDPKSVWISSSPQTSYPTKLFGVFGLQGFWIGQSLDLNERKSLMQVLEVDGLAVVQIRARLNRTDTIGIGSFSMGNYRPSAITEFRLYSGNAEDPIWIDLMAAGESTDDSAMQISGVTDSELINQRVVEAATKSFKALTERALNSKE